MKLKNIVTTTLLAVVCFVISMIGGMASSLFGTFAMFVHTSIGSLLTATVFLTMCRKIKTRGTIFYYYLIFGLVYIIMGFPPMIFIMLASGIIGELIVGNEENYENDNRIGLAFIISELIYALHGFFFILFLGTEGLANTFPNLFTLEQAEGIKAVFFNPKIMIIIVVIQLIASFIGVLLAKYIYGKHFDKKDRTDGILQ